MVKAHFILKQFSYEKGFTDPSSTIYYCKNRFICTSLKKVVT